MVAKLAKDGSQILTEMTSEKAHLWHMATGLSGEAAELLDHNGADNLLEELGDIEFYLEGIRESLEAERSRELLESVVPVQFDLYLRGTVVSSGTILDLVKKHVAYNQPLNVPLMLNEIYILEACLCRLRQCRGLTLEQVLEGNMRKLAKRYKNFDYTDAAAKARADKEGSHD